MTEKAVSTNEAPDKYCELLDGKNPAGDARLMADLTGAVPRPCLRLAGTLPSAIGTGHASAARRGWLTSGGCINTWSKDNLHVVEGEAVSVEAIASFVTDIAKGQESRRVSMYSAFVPADADPSRAPAPAPAPAPDPNDHSTSARRRKYVEKLLADCRRANLPGGEKLINELERALAAMPPPMNSSDR